MVSAMWACGDRGEQLGSHSLPRGQEVSPGHSAPATSSLYQSAYNVLSAGCQVAGRALSGLLIPLLLVPRQYGTYVYFVWLATTLIQLSALGLPQAAQRYVARAAHAAERAAIARFLRRAGIAFTVCWLVVALLWQVVRERQWIDEWAVFVLLCLGVILGVYATLQIAALKGSRDFALPAMVEALGQGTKLVV